MTKSRPKTLRLIPAVHMAAHAIALYVAEMKDLGVSQAEAHVLAHLHEHGASTIADIHARFGHRRSTLTSVLDRLVDNGLVKRSASPGDRRSVVITLTSRGTTVAASVHERLLELERRTYSALPSTDIAAVEATLGAFSKLAAADTP